METCVREDLQVQMEEIVGTTEALKSLSMWF